MTLLQLQYIIKIVEAGSMNEAARDLYISQPTLSAQVRDLEEELGFSIFQRSRQGISLTSEGAHFLVYARQLVEQASMIEDRFLKKSGRNQLCTISTQHFMFALEALAEQLRTERTESYEVALRETTTRDIIEQVAQMRSDIGILYLSEYNRDIITRMLRTKHLTFYPLFRANLHVFLSSNNPLADRDRVSLDELRDYPFIKYEQGDDSSLFFAEEAIWPNKPSKVITISDRASMLNLIQTVNAYTISTGIDNEDLNPDKVATVRLDTDRTMIIGWIKPQRTQLSEGAVSYLKHLQHIIVRKGYKLIDPKTLVAELKEKSAAMVHNSATGRLTEAEVVDHLLAPRSGSPSQASSGTQMQPARVPQEPGDNATLGSVVGTAAGSSALGGVSAKFGADERARVSEDSAENLMDLASTEAGSVFFRPEDDEIDPVDEQSRKRRDQRHQNSQH